MVIGIMPHLFEVIVFTRHTQALLRIGDPIVFDRRVAQENILELVHTRIGKHQGRIIFDHHRSRRYNQMSLALEKIEKCCSDLIRVHNRYTIRLFCSVNIMRSKRGCKIT